MRRQAIELGLDRLVRENRFTIAVVIPLVAAVVLLASARGVLPAGLGFNPVLLVVGTLAMRLPLIAGLLPVASRQTGVFLGVAVVYTFGIEFIGVATGWPYGDFTYGVDLGPMVAGVPLALPLFFLPLAVNAQLLARGVLGRFAERWSVRVPAAVGILIGIDLVLEPGATGLGFWVYHSTGAYYGIPRSNFAGWLLSGTVVVALLDRAFPPGQLADRLRGPPYIFDDLVSFLVLWGAINAVFQHWLPVAVAALIGIALTRATRNGPSGHEHHLTSIRRRSPWR